MPYINVRGVEHYYEWICIPSAEIKPVMVFIHSWAGSARYWKSTVNALCDQFDCWLYDLRGFGRSVISRSLRAWHGKPTLAPASEFVLES